MVNLYNIRMNMLQYLQQKYRVDRPNIITFAEARIFGVPTPLTRGWLARHENTEITDKMLLALKESAVKRYQRDRRFSQDALDALGVSALEYSAIPKTVKKSEKRVKRKSRMAERIEAEMVALARPANSVDPMSTGFLSTYEWRAVRMQALRKYGAVCQCCGASPKTGAVMNVDHIKPRKIFPELALDLNNLQVLCGECNHGKGNWDMTDWRRTAKA